MAAREIYKDSAGTRLPSVTTILSRFKESGGLLYWANQAGLDGKTLDEARAPACDAGTLAHDLVEAHIQRRPFTPDANRYSNEVISLAQKGFENYLRWKDQVKIEIRHTEVSLVSERHKFGGRLDAIGEQAMNGSATLCLPDWKCSNAIYVDYLLQIAGYKLLWEENYPEHPLTGGFHLCRFSKEYADFSHHYYGNLDDEAETFIKMRELYDCVKRAEKRCK